jgi:hypothetical protein
MKLIAKLKAWIAQRDRKNVEDATRTHPVDSPHSAEERPPGMPEGGARRG